MPRLPIPGSDDGTWGEILNSFLSVSLNSDGSINSNSLIQAGAITTINSIKPSNGSITLTASDVGALTQSVADLRYIQLTSLSQANGVASLDSSGNVPLSQLANVPSPPVTSVNSKTGAVDLTYTDVGAASAGNNSDITSLSGLTNPLSINQGGTGSTTQNFVDLSSNQTIGGLKTLSSGLNVEGMFEIIPTTYPSGSTMSANTAYFSSNLDVQNKYAQALYIQPPQTGGGRIYLGSTPTSLGGAGVFALNLAGIVNMEDFPPSISINGSNDGWLFNPSRDGLRIIVNQQSQSGDILLAPSFGSGTNNSFITGPQEYAPFRYRQIQFKSWAEDGDANTPAGTYILDTEYTNTTTPHTVFRENGVTIASILANGSLNLSLGAKIEVTTGTNASVGTATLSGGTVTVSTTAVTANSIIFLTTQNPGTVANLGEHYIGTITAGTSFVITSTNASDNSTVGWLIIN